MCVHGEDTFPPSHFSLCSPIMAQVGIQSTHTPYQASKRKSHYRCSLLLRESCLLELGSSGRKQQGSLAGWSGPKPAKIRGPIGPWAWAGRALHLLSSPIPPPLVPGCPPVYFHSEEGSSARVCASSLLSSPHRGLRFRLSNLLNQASGGRLIDEEGFCTKAPHPHPFLRPPAAAATRASRRSIGFAPSVPRSLFPIPRSHCSLI
jgi:hypothetical protein